MIQFKGSLLIICLCFAWISASGEHNRQLAKRNFIKDLEPKEKDEMSKFALNTLNSLDPTYSRRVLCQILEGKKQFASGIVYKLKLLVVIVSDEDYNPSTKSDVLCKENEEQVVCEIDVLRSYAATDYSPINAQVVKSECGDSAENSGIVKREAKKFNEPLVGGKTKKDPESEEIQNVAKSALAKLDSDSGSSCNRRVNKILKAATQVVAGKLTDLTIEICNESCDQTANSNPCQVCSLTVWEKPWENFLQVSNFDCPNSAQNSAKDIERLQFEQFVRKYEKTYSSGEESEHRFRIFRANLKKIKMLNDMEQGTAVYAINEFADLSKSEFEKYYLGLKPTDTKIERQAEVPDIKIPDEFDWRNYNAVTPVKNQGMCGSCWAFSTIGNVEGQWAIRNNKLVSFSEQELIDCDQVDHGCGGGYMTDAYVALEKLGGIETETDYPYEGFGEKCSFNKSKIVALVIGYQNISSNETVMAQYLYKYGPISVALNAFAMQFYFGGVSHPWKFLCNPNNLNHGVLIVGYGVSKNKPYWLIKNSWGPRWGEKGYYRLYRGVGSCGINLMATCGLVE